MKLRKLQSKGAVEDWADLVIAGVLVLFGYLLIHTFLVNFIEVQKVDSEKQVEATESTVLQSLQNARLAYVEQRGLLVEKGNTPPQLMDPLDFNSLDTLRENTARRVLPRYPLRKEGPVLSEVQHGQQ